MDGVDRSEHILLLALHDPLFGDVLDAYLTSRGYRVRRVRDGRRALEVVRTQPCLAVVTELDIPGVDGLEIAASTARLPEAPPIILATYDAWASRWDAAARERLAIAAVVKRPCPLGVIATAIERASGRSAPRPSLTLKAAGQK